MSGTPTGNESLNINMVSRLTLILIIAVFLKNNCDSI
jgi:hypothetical protein